MAMTHETAPGQHDHSRATTSNLLYFLEKVTASVESGVPVDVDYLDFAKAFVKVPVERLLKKVRAHGIRGKLYNWISAWLKECWQHVVLNGTASGWMAVLSVVPQGSILGPLFFLIFINDQDQDIASAAIVVQFNNAQDRDAFQSALDGWCTGQTRGEWPSMWPSARSCTLAKGTLSMTRSIRAC